MQRAEAKIAARLADHLGLVPPVPIRAVVGQHADIEEDSIPGDCDAVVLGLDGSRERPLIVLDANQPRRRKRFTLAHELGHILIPWHLGTLGCTPLSSTTTLSDAWSDDEKEANRFASGILLPRSFLQPLCSGQPALPEILREMEKAKVSASAGVLALGEMLPPGHLLVVERRNAVEMEVTSPGTVVNHELLWPDIDVAGLDARAKKHGSVEHQGCEVHWWQFVERRALPGDLDSRDATTLLRTAIAAAGVPEQEQHGLLLSINGMVGGALSAAGRPEDAEGILATLWHRFEMRPDLVDVTSQREFEAYLAKKAITMSERRARRRPGGEGNAPNR